MEHRLDTMGIDVKDVIEEVCHAYRDLDQLSQSRLRDIIFGARRSKQVTMKDIMALRNYLSESLEALEERLCRDMNLDMVTKEAAVTKIKAIRGTTMSMSLGGLDR